MQLLLVVAGSGGGPAFRFPWRRLALDIHPLTQVFLTHSYEAIKICIYISCPSSLLPTLPCLAATSFCRTARVLAGLSWSEHNVSGGRGSGRGRGGTEADSTRSVDDDIASHRPCLSVRPTLNCLEDPLCGGVEEPLHGLIILGSDFSVCEEERKGGRLRMTLTKNRAAARKRAREEGHQ